MALLRTKKGYVVFTEKSPSTTQKEKLGIKKTNYYTKNTNKPIYTMDYLKESPTKQYDNYNTYKQVKWNSVLIEPKKYNNTNKNLYYEDLTNN